MTRKMITLFKTALIAGVIAVVGATTSTMMLAGCSPSQCASFRSTAVGEFVYNVAKRTADNAVPFGGSLLCARDEPEDETDDFGVPDYTAQAVNQAKSSDSARSCQANPEDDACTRCVRASCCTEVLECWKDGSCTCAASCAPGASCGCGGSGTGLDAAVTCFETKCAQECTK